MGIYAPHNFTLPCSKLILYDVRKLPTVVFHGLMCTVSPFTLYVLHRRKCRTRLRSSGSKLPQQRLRFSHLLCCCLPHRAGWWNSCFLHGRKRLDVVLFIRDPMNIGIYSAAIKGCARSWIMETTLGRWFVDDLIWHCATRSSQRSPQLQSRCCHTRPVPHHYALRMLMTHLITVLLLHTWNFLRLLNADKTCQAPWAGFYNYIARICAISYELAILLSTDCIADWLCTPNLR